MRYDTLHLLLGEGSFVLAACEGTFGGTAAAFYDLFRVGGGLIREHWDVVEAIPAREHWQYENGKFGSCGCRRGRQSPVVHLW